MYVGKARGRRTRTLTGPQALAIMALVMAAVAAGLVALLAPQDRLYFTGKKTTVTVILCETRIGRRHQSVVCDGIWVLPDGRHGSGRVDHAPQGFGRRVTARATTDHATAISPVLFWGENLVVLAMIGGMIRVLIIGGRNVRRARAEGAGEPAKEPGRRSGKGSGRA